MYVKERLKAGQKVIGTLMRVIQNPAIAYFAKNAGLDFMLFDCEHSNYDISQLHDIFLMCNALGVEGFLRVPKGTSEYISRALDAGATGVMVPTVETVEYAREIVKWSKYLPIGQRGFTSNNAHTGYRPLKHVDIMESGNNRVLTIAQIETGLGVANADKIAAVEGIDVLLVGHNDLSVSLGIPGQITSDRIMNAIRTVIDACKKAGKIFGFGADLNYLSNFKDDLGMVMINNDVSIINNAFKNIVTDFEILKK
jgi:2-keto-3-deoxy-L-rhamnonate aldolase RhmA